MAQYRRKIGIPVFDLFLFSLIFGVVSINVNIQNIFLYTYSEELSLQTKIIAEESWVQKNVYHVVFTPGNA